MSPPPFVAFTPPAGPPPAVLPSPFDEGPPHPWAEAAAAVVQAALGAAPARDDGDAGKMWGALVARAPTGDLVLARAFSGQLGGAWTSPGCAPPLFDPAVRAALEGPGEARIKARCAERAAMAAEANVPALERMVAHLRTRQAKAYATLLAEHAERRAARAEARPGADDALCAQLDAQSARDKADRKRRREADAFTIAPAEAMLDRHIRRLAEYDASLRIECADLMRRLHDLYVLRDFQGASTSLRGRFTPYEPPTGAGDCAAPKLLGLAQHHGLRPVVLVEFWWGPPPPGGGRVHGRFYPACRGKCGPLLPFMLGGLPVAPPRAATDTRLAALAPDPDRPGELTIAYEDQWLVVVDKPAGLLSVPGRGAERQDAVATRLRAIRPDATGPLLVHRLDEDTSGLLLAAKDPETHAALQRLFETRTLEKVYEALLTRPPAHGRHAGEITLPLRAEPHDRPRQVVDRGAGRPASTTWRLIATEPGGVRVQLAPHTGRTHQLRVHAAHPDGLDAPIVGDRLYGTPAGRLMLHAASLAFTHPRTGAVVTVRSPTPF